MRIAVIGTGGSISIPGRHSLDFYEYRDHSPPLEAVQLLARFPEVANAADVTPIRFRTVPSSAFGPADWIELRDAVGTITAPPGEVDGVVITHGTATLEETAFFLALTLDTDIPVVLVGAQRPPTALSTDAGVNLLHAVLVAASADAKSVGGPFVVMNGEIHDPATVTKRSNYALAAFSSKPLGPVGLVAPDRQVRFYRRLECNRPKFDLEGVSALPRVDIAYSFAGSDGACVSAFVAAGASGIVSAGLPPGTVTPSEWVRLLEARDRGVLVVQSSRATEGPTLPREKLRDAGIIAARSLNPQKARVLASLALTRTQDAEEIDELFSMFS